MSSRTRIILFLVLTVIVTITVFSFDPVPQDPAYHDFADSRSWLHLSKYFLVDSLALRIVLGDLPGLE